MNPLLRLVGCVLAAVALVPLGAGAQEYRWVRGTVTAMTENALTVYVADSDLNLTFAVDESSVILATGRTWVHPPEQTRPKLSNVVRIGGTVEVHYAREGPRNRAGLILTSPSAAREAGRSLAGRVRAVSGDDLTVAADGREYTFAVAPPAQVIGPGIGSRQSPGDKQQPELTNLVVRNDSVLVYYRLVGTTLLATEIRVLSMPR